MRSFLAAAILAMGLAVSTSASANVIYNLSGVTLTGGGTLTGSFTLNNSLSSVVGANIVASASGSSPGYIYAYPTSTTITQSLPSQYFELTSEISPYNILRFYFSSLTATSATLLLGGYSYEWEAGYNRTVTAGSIVVGTVPEPASLAVLASGLLGLVGLRRLRQRNGAPR